MPYEQLLLLNENEYKATSTTVRGEKWIDIKDFNEQKTNCYEAKDREFKFKF